MCNITCQITHVILLYCFIILIILKIKYHLNYSNFFEVTTKNVVGCISRFSLSLLVYNSMLCLRLHFTSGLSPIPVQILNGYYDPLYKYEKKKEL